MRTFYHTTPASNVPEILDDQEGLTIGNPPRWNGPNGITLDRPAEHVYLFSCLFEAQAFGTRTAHFHKKQIGVWLSMVVLKIQANVPLEPDPLEEHEIRHPGTWWRTKSPIKYQSIKMGWYLSDLKIGWKYDRRPIEQQIPRSAVILVRRRLQCVYAADAPFFPHENGDE